MNDKNIKEAMKQYIDTQADSALSESTEQHDFSSLDEKVYQTIGAKQERKARTVTWSIRKISTLAASFLLVIGLSITAIFMLNKEPPQTTNDVNYTIMISYENEQYGYYSNRVVIDKYGLEDIADLKQNPDLFTDSLTDVDITHIDSVIDKDSIVGGKIYPFSDEVIILQSNGQFYYFEKITTE